MENGVGLMKSFEYEVMEEIEKIKTSIDLNKRYIVATGTLAYDFMVNLCHNIMEKFNGLDLECSPHSK